MSQKRLRAGVAVWTTVSALALSAGQVAPAEGDRPRPSLNLYGVTGLIDMPSAQSQPDGQISISYSQFDGFSRRNFTFQILPRVSGTLRYSTIKDWGGSDEDGPRSPDYDLYDRSFDVEFQLLTEDYEGWRPSLALGLRDFLGTGVYSGEYLVATKTVADDFTLTAGIGWGRLAGYGRFENPFCAAFDSFCERDADIGEGGEVEFGTFFHGESSALFGGVEWRATDQFTLKAEYSSDAYRREQQSPAATFERDSPFNFGAEYRWREGVTLGAYYMYGSEVGFNIALSGNPQRPITPQDLGTGPLPVNPRAADAPSGTSWASNPAARDQLAEALAEVLEQEGVRLETFAPLTAQTVEVAISNQLFSEDPKAVGRTARVLAVAMPASVETFRITLIYDQLRTSTVVIDRSDLEAQVDRPNAGEKSWETTVVESAVPSLGGDVWRRDDFPNTRWSIFPQPYLFLLTPSDPIRLGVNIDAEAIVEFAPGLSVTGRVSQPVINSPDDPEQSDSELQPVRSDTPLYFAGFTPRLAQLTADYVFKLSPDVYGRGSVGYLERMFAGVSGEVLWKPSQSPFGLGLELNYVAQRNPDNLGFGFFDYQVATGHASFYWETGYYGLDAQIDAGRYLAGDWGATFSLTRRFANGWAVGGYFTRTNVTAEDFGEGSFDKGVVLQIPLAWTTPFETQAVNSISLTSVSRDGGARLDISNRLYPTVRDTDRNTLRQNWGSFWQ